MDREALMQSLELIDGQEQALVPRFYQILFERYPEVRPLFSADIRPQEKMLNEMIVAVVDHLDDAPWLKQNLGAQGRTHVDKGVTTPMYDAVSECLIAAMKELGGEAWTPEMSAQWSAALAAVSELMLAGVDPEKTTA